MLVGVAAEYLVELGPGLLDAGGQPGPNGRDSCVVVSERIIVRCRVLQNVDRDRDVGAQRLAGRDLAEHVV